MIVHKFATSIHGPFVNLSVKQFVSVGDGETGNGNGNNLDGSEQADIIDDTANAVQANDGHGTFSTSVFGQFTDLIIFALLAVILCCILACCFILCMVRKRKKKQAKSEQVIAMGSMSPGETTNENKKIEGHPQPPNFRRAATSPIDHIGQQIMTPQSISTTANVFAVYNHRYK